MSHLIRITLAAAVLLACSIPLSAQETETEQAAEATPAQKLTQLRKLQMQMLAAAKTKNLDKFIELAAPAKVRDPKRVAMMKARAKQTPQMFPAMEAALLQVIKVEPEWQEDGAAHFPVKEMTVFEVGGDGEGEQKTNGVMVFELEDGKWRMTKFRPQAALKARAAEGEQPPAAEGSDEEE